MLAFAELEQARALLVVPDQLVRELTDFTRDHRLLTVHRRRLAEAIEGLTSLTLPGG